MKVNEPNITCLQDKLWYIIKCEDQVNSTGIVQPQNLNTNNTNEYVIIL